MKGLQYPPLHVTEFCGEMQGKFKVGLARLKSLHREHTLFQAAQKEHYPHRNFATHLCRDHGL